MDFVGIEVVGVPVPSQEGQASWSSAADALDRYLKGKSLYTGLKVLATMSDRLDR
jgi:hypothetical protein